MLGRISFWFTMAYTSALYVARVLTSLLMHLDPGMQDLDVLPEDRNELPAGASNNGIQESNAEFGRKAAEAIIQAVRERVEEFLEHGEQYQGHVHFERRFPGFRVQAPHYFSCSACQVSLSSHCRIKAG